MYLLEDTDLRSGHRSEAVHGFESYIYNLCKGHIFSTKLDPLSKYLPSTDWVAKHINRSIQLP